MTRFAPIRVRACAPVLVLMAGLVWPAGLDRAAAQAQEQAGPPAGAEEGRYTFHRMGDGFVRLNERTGQLAQCGWGPNGWSCKLVPDERAALESEITRLQRENAELKKSLLSRGIELPAGVVASAPVAPPAGSAPDASASAPVPPAAIPDPSKPDPSAQEPKLPSDAELDRAFNFMKKVWRRLVDLMADLQRDIQRKS